MKKASEIKAKLADLQTEIENAVNEMEKEACGITYGFERDDYTAHRNTLLKTKEGIEELINRIEYHENHKTYWPDFK